MLTALAGSTATMNDDVSPVSGGNAQLPATVAPPRSRQPVAVRAPDEGRTGDNRGPGPVTCHRLWWHWLLIGLLVAVSAAVTALFAVTLATDLFQRHWAQAVDSSREAVPALVGWGALFMIFFVGETTGATRRPYPDRDEVAATQRRSAAEDDAVRQAQQRVRSLTARLRMLAAGQLDEPARAGSVRSLQADRSLARQVAETSARLERARQWLISAQAAQAATRESAASLAGEPGRGDNKSGRP